jgi:hypothetical protein
MESDLLKKSSRPVFSAALRRAHRALASLQKSCPPDAPLRFAPSGFIGGALPITVSLSQVIIPCDKRRQTMTAAPGTTPVATGPN